jgi:hypothetical protein
MEEKVIQQMEANLELLKNEIGNKVTIVIKTWLGIPLKLYAVIYDAKIEAINQKSNSLVVHLKPKFKKNMYVLRFEKCQSCAIFKGFIPIEFINGSRGSTEDASHILSKIKDLNINPIIKI